MVLRSVSLPSVLAAPQGLTGMDEVVVVNASVRIVNAHVVPIWVQRHTHAVQTMELLFARSVRCNC